MMSTITEPVAAAPTTVKAVAKRTPTVLWAQRSDRVFITIEVSDAPEAVVTLNEQSIVFSARDYAVEISLYAPIDKENSRFSVTDRQVEILLRKPADATQWWPRLVQESRKPHWLKTDFGKWRDEDEGDEDAPVADDFGAGAMGGMGGMGGMDWQSMLAENGGKLPTGADDMPQFDDSDDEEDEEVPPVDATLPEVTDVSGESEKLETSE